MAAVVRSGSADAQENRENEDFLRGSDKPVGRGGPGLRVRLGSRGGLELPAGTSQWLVVVVSSIYSLWINYFL